MKYNYVKVGWDKIKFDLDKVDTVHSFDETKLLLLKDDYYITLFGKAKNRTLIKEYPILYKSIYKHSEILEKTIKKQDSYFGNYNFTNRIKFIVDYNGNIENMKCECGEKYTFNKYCRYCPEPKKVHLGKHHTDESKRKMRVSTIGYIKRMKGQFAPRYNIYSIPIIENYGKEHGYNFQHAENGGEYHIKELGYFVDGYDKEKNVVIEVDERHHFRNGELKQKDIIRQQEIEKYLECKFIRISV
ncbi:hypothetical protein H8D04_00165 [bacterium]|nr:hypothetical protein [bacterium]